MFLRHTSSQDRFHLFYYYTDWAINFWFTCDFVFYLWLAEDRLAHLTMVICPQK